MIINLFIISLAIQFIFFVPAYAFKTDKFTDFSYGVTFIALAYFAYTLGSFSPEKLFLFGMVFLWGIRLAYYLLKRILRIGRDKRFDGKRENFYEFIKFWLFQGLVVPVIILPTSFFMVSQTKINTFIIIGFLIWLTGFLFEAVSDSQKYKFIQNPKNKGRWIDVGLWKYSRHPNYFGEILCWLGIYVYTFSFLNIGDRFLALLSPITISLLLIYVSGIPILEKKSDEKWGKSKDYIEYKKRTPVLLPSIQLWKKLIKKI